MNDKTVKAKLKNLQAEAERLREKLDLSAPGAIIYKAPWFDLGDEIVVVEADGFGGATTMIINGNYPLDYCTLYEGKFRTEGAACRTAELIVDKKTPPESILG